MPHKRLSEIAQKFSKGLKVSSTSVINGKFAPKTQVPFYENQATVVNGVIIGGFLWK